MNASAGNASAESVSPVESSAVNATPPDASAAHASAVDTRTVNAAPGALRSEGQDARIVERLVAIVGREGVRLDLPITHELIADMVGCARETVTRAFEELQRSGFVRRRGRFYELLVAPELLATS